MHWSASPSLDAKAPAAAAPQVTAVRNLHFFLKGVYLNVIPPSCTRPTRSLPVRPCGWKVGSSEAHVCPLLSARAARTPPAASYLRRASAPLLPQTGESHCSSLISAPQRPASRGVRPLPLSWDAAHTNPVRFFFFFFFLLFFFFFFFCMRCCANDAPCSFQ